MNKRDEIKKLIFEALFGMTDAGEKVEISRSRKVDTDVLPCISIYTTKESAKRIQISPQSYQFTASLEILVFAKMDEFSEETLDKITYQIEDILVSLDIPTLLEGGQEIILGDTEIGIFGGDSRDIIPSASMSFDVTYEVQVPECEAEDTETISLVNNVESLY